ncbi:MAG: LuxR C-terminal-related transcriptional regulator [Chloroflexota bacterium]
MMDHLVQTKLFIPPARPTLVPRLRIIEKLNAGLAGKLTLICAPAGFGKTTLISDWLQQTDLLVGWLSLDPSDNDPTRFFQYVIAALQTIEPTLGQSVQEMLQSPQPPSPESLLPTLINNIAACSSKLAIVLDDYHVIETQSIHDAFTFLLDHLPPQMHLVIASRSDPLLPLPRLRARGELSELRAADLRFTSDEAATFLNQMMALNLSEEDIAALELRTEGWIAGLQLAALALQGTPSDTPAQGRADTTSATNDFIAAFTGSHRFVLDYLVEEVLRHQPDPVRNFLLQTSIIDRLNGPLCDAVRFGNTETSQTAQKTVITSQEEGQGLLQALERGNLFVVPLDDERQWYRYHHLFADVLQTHLREEQPDLIPILHQRASAWYEQNDLPVDAVRHALSAKDFERVANLLELAWREIDRGFQSTRTLGWLKTLPDKVIGARPVLSTEYAWALLGNGEFEAAEIHLRNAQRWLDVAADVAGEVRESPEALATKMVVVDEEEFRSLPASIAAARAYLAQSLGDIDGTVRYARQALDLLPEADHHRRVAPTMFLGFASWASGDLEAAHHAFAESLASMRLAGNIPRTINSSFILADIRVAQGHLREAVSTYEQSLQLAKAQGDAVFPGMANLYLRLAELHYEQGDLEAARQFLQKSEALGKQVALTLIMGWSYRLCLAQAQIKQAEGDLKSALDLLHKAEHLRYKSPIPNVRPAAALKTRILIQQGRLAEALRWVRERSLSATDDLSYLREFEHITLAKVLIAQYKRNRDNGFIHEAMGLLKRLLKAADDGKRMGNVIEILVEQALAHQTQGSISRALKPMERALTLAEPEGYVRIFVDEGEPMAALLQEAAKRNIASNYVRQLLRAIEKVEEKASVTQLFEPLSDRELEVLRLLKTDLNGPKIAKKLLVSLNTMRTHTKNIYTKLGVNSRRAAVRRADELDLL